MEVRTRRDWAKGLREQRWSPTLALVAVAATIAVGALVAYRPVLAAAVAFILLVAVSRSRESAVTLWLGLRVLMFSGYVPVPLGEAMLALITLVALARHITDRQSLRAPRAHLLWLLLLLLVGLNLAYFRFDPESLYYAREIFFENALLVILIANTRSRWLRDGAVTAVGLILIGVGIVAALESVIGRPLFLNPGRVAYAELAALQTFEGASRLGSLLLNPDLLGAAMVLGFVVWTGIALESRGVRRWLSLLFAAGLLCVAFLTLSRTVFVGVPTGLGVLFTLAVSRGRVSIGQAAIVVTGVSAAVFTALLLVPDALVRITANPTDPLRLGAYETALRIISAHPFAGLGGGWERYLALAEPYRALDQYRPLAHPHNSFLEFAAMFGLPVALVVVLLISKAFAGVLPFRTTPPASAIPVAGVAVMIIMSLFGDPITIPVLSNMFWALWAVDGRMAPPALVRPSVGARRA